MSAQWVCILVKGANGRTWYRADSANTTDYEFLAKEVARLRIKYTNLRFRVGNANAGYKSAPMKYTPWVKEGME